MSNASAYFTLDRLDGKHDAKDIKKELDTLPGVQSVSVSQNRVAVDFDTTGIQSHRISRQLEKMGYEILDSKCDVRQGAVE